ncbi:Methyltransferase domain protein [Mariniflexile rhizosphaerae]|uniref:class I SAM-dependent methyltransferase n=1 Tax=unclassified Mariniflexile TaxID=2643887 RepID=UPI000CB93927|nr:class I SAM-dependent methyltransferase [Mariniflexile sp. TRM1-10]AXP81918.1 Methyltransferase domain protein [Mariniflexile sp. TRM1-10]PLB20693.1 MAG: SAM-dependent methyltransferase [Flavobacteriaceae bacterium FS1-H7996/R]
MKDNFSLHSDSYKKYRPQYPSDFYSYLNSILRCKNKAWDCGTGNGQVAFELAKTFNIVHATDISQTQISHAIQADNIVYSIQPAENTNFEAKQFDLITIAQAIHWFDFQKFYKEVRRTAKHNALICVIGYGRLQISEKIDAVITEFYNNTIGAYWDKERNYIDEHYQTIPFPFDEIKTPEFTNRIYWTAEHVIGYINTWSAVKHFIKKNGFNPTDQLRSDIEKNWGFELRREVRFPLLLRMGIVHD